MLKIWGRNTSINVQKVMWAIGELGIPHERIDVGGAFGRTKEPFYLAMNPNSLVPTLRGGRRLHPVGIEHDRALSRRQVRRRHARARQACRSAPAPASGWTGCSRSARRRSTAVLGPDPHAAREARPRHDRRSAREDHRRAAHARRAARQDRVRRRQQVLDGRHPGRADHLSLPQAGAGRQGLGLDNLERWFLGLEQRKAFKEQILPVPLRELNCSPVVMSAWCRQSAGIKAAALSMMASASRTCAP